MYKKLIEKHLKVRVSESDVPGISITKAVQKKAKEQNDAAYKEEAKKFKELEKDYAKEDTNAIKPPKRDLSDSEQEYHDEYEIMNGMESLRYDGTVDDKFKDRAEKAIVGDPTMGNDPTWANVVPAQPGFTGPDFGKNLIGKIKASAKKKAAATQAIYQFGDDIEVAKGSPRINSRNVAIESTEPKNILKEEFDVRPIKGRSKDHKKNTHFAIHKPTNGIVFAWDYKGYDNDELNSDKDSYFIQDIMDTVGPNMEKFKKSDFTILTKAGLAKKGIDLDDYLNFVGDKYTDDKNVDGENTQVTENNLIRHFKITYGDDGSVEKKDVIWLAKPTNLKGKNHDSEIPELNLGDNQEVIPAKDGSGLKNEEMSGTYDSGKSTRDMLFKNKGIKDVIKQERIDSIRKSIEDTGYDTSEISDEDILHIYREVAKMKDIVGEQKKNNKSEIKENKMKRLKFTKPFNGRNNALKLIPEHYKVENKVFEMTDGNETYKVRWEKDKAVVLESKNQTKITEDVDKMKHLMGYSSRDTLGTLKGEDRITENNKFSGFMGKAKGLISEDEEGNRIIGLIREMEDPNNGTTKTETDPGEEITSQASEAKKDVKDSKGKALSMDKAKEIDPASGVKEAYELFDDEGNVASSLPDEVHMDEGLFGGNNIEKQAKKEKELIANVMNRINSNPNLKRTFIGLQEKGDTKKAQAFINFFKQNWHQKIVAPVWDEATGTYINKTNMMSPNA